MPKIIVTRPDRQILRTQEIIEHPNDVFEVVLPNDEPPGTEYFLLYSISNGRYWKERWCGYTPDMDEAHHYPYPEALRLTQETLQDTDYRDLRTVMIPAPPTTRRRV